MCFAHIRKSKAIAADKGRRGTQHLLWNNLHEKRPLQLLPCSPVCSPTSPLPPPLPVGWQRTPPEWHLQITRPRVLGPLTREPLLSTRRDSPAFCHIITANPLKVAPLKPPSTTTSSTHTHTLRIPSPRCMQTDACRCIRTNLQGWMLIYDEPLSEWPSSAQTAGQEPCQLQREQRSERT